MRVLGSVAQEPIDEELTMDDRVEVFRPERQWLELLEGHPDPGCLSCRDVAIHLAWVEIGATDNPSLDLGNDREFLASHHRSFC
jgi:hypothetical protein